MSEPPRFAGLSNGRAHLRLLAAVGILASAAIATGALASLFANAPSNTNSPRPSAALGEPEPGPALGLVAQTLAAGDGMIVLELRVREAELAAARARTALRNARQLGHDDRDLESFERRLEQLGAASPIEAVRRGYAPAAGDVHNQRRAHLRAIASASREL
jgi:hypothetical protein